MKMHIRMHGAEKGIACHRSKRKKKTKKTKVFTRALSVVLMDSFLSQETLSHPLLVPILEDPKMELKTFLLPMRLGLLTAFHQSAEVNIRSFASIRFLFGVGRLFLNVVGSG